MTTLACLLGAVWPPDRDVVVAECDPAGSDLAPRFGLSSKTGMASFALAQRRGSLGGADLTGHVQRLPGGLEVMVGPIGGEPAIALDDELAALVWPLFPDVVDVIIDCGRLAARATGQQAVIAEADQVFLLTHLSPAGIAQARWSVEQIRKLRPTADPRLLVTGNEKIPIHELSEVLHADIVDVIPHDQKAAAIVCGLPGRASTLRRSSLVACARRIMRQAVPQSDPTEDTADCSDGLVADGYPARKAY